LPVQFTLHVQLECGWILKVKYHIDLIWEPIIKIMNIICLKFIPISLRHSHFHPYLMGRNIIFSMNYRKCWLLQNGKQSFIYLIQNIQFDGLGLVFFLCFFCLHHNFWLQGDCHYFHFLILLYFNFLHRCDWN